MVVTGQGYDERTEFEQNHRRALLGMIVDGLDTERRNLAEGWSPPMTADGRHMEIARDIEKWLHAVWQTRELDTRPGYRPPRSQYQATLKRILESDDAFGLF